MVDRVDKAVKAFYGLTIAVTIGLGLYLSTMLEVGGESLIMLLIAAGILTTQVYSLYILEDVRKRLYNTTQKKQPEEQNGGGEVEPEENSQGNVE